MTPADFTYENTNAGQQYVIPGTERIVKPKRRIFNTETTPAGDQLDISLSFTGGREPKFRLIGCRSWSFPGFRPVGNVKLFTGSNTQNHLSAAC